jgi:hypothetical protein
VIRSIDILTCAVKWSRAEILPRAKGCDVGTSKLRGCSLVQLIADAIIMSIMLNLHFVEQCFSAGIGALQRDVEHATAGSQS